MKPDLDYWLADPALRVSHLRCSAVTPPQLWEAAQRIRVCDTRVLGRLIRWRIPGIAARTPFDEMFRAPPFAVLSEQDGGLVSGLVGRIWTLRRDYPQLADGEEFRGWTQAGTVRVLFAVWVQDAGFAGASLGIEARVSPTDRDGRIGLAAVRPLVRASQHLIASEGIESAVRLAERR